MDKRSIFFKLSVICFFFLIVHLSLNILVPKPVSFFVVIDLQLYYSLTLFLSVLYIVKGIKKDPNRLWVNYMVIITVKFFLFLGFVFGLQWYFKISKMQALINVFVWFFIYLFIEVKLIINEIKLIKNE